MEIILKKKLYCLAKNLRVGDDSPMLFYKKSSLSGKFLAHVRIFMTRSALGKKDQKTKGTLIVVIRNFYRHLLEIEAQEIVYEKIKVTLPEHCPIKIVICFVF